MTHLPTNLPPTALAAYQALAGPEVDELPLSHLARLLDGQPGVAELSDHDYAAVLGWLGWRYRRCVRCNDSVVFVDYGPQPGWWRHVDVPRTAHPAQPRINRAGAR